MIALTISLLQKSASEKNENRCIFSKVFDKNTDSIRFGLPCMTVIRCSFRRYSL